MQQFIYPAIFYIDEDETKVYFPHLDISTSGDNYDEAFLFAKELLKVYFLYAIANDLDFNFPSNFNDIKTYMYLKVKLFFDPPLNSSVLSAIERQISELEFRLSVDAVAKSLEVVNDDEII